METHFKNISPNSKCRRSSKKSVDVASMSIQGVYYNSSSSCSKENEGDTKITTKQN